MEPRRTIRILLVEDTPADVEIMRDAIAHETDQDFEVTHVSRLAEGLGYLSRAPVDLVLLDLQLPDAQGLETVERVRAQAPATPIVVLTASDNDALALQAVQRGAQDYLVKGYVQVYGKLLGRAIRYAIERARGEEALRGAHAQTEQLLSSLPSILIRLNKEGRITHWNAVAGRMFGLPARAVLGKTLAECGVQWEKEIVAGAVEECKRERVPVSMDDLAFMLADGTQGFIGLTVIPMPGDDPESDILLFGADVTERSRLQQQLLHAQKMETIGRFAGGIAHDFNNFLQVILGFSWLIRARHQKDTELMSDLQEIVHAAESASGMVHQLLAFSRKQPLQPKVFDINQTVRSMGRLLQQFVGEHIQLHLDPDPGPLVVKMDPTGLEQILMNLCGNARDAMAQGGTLTIRTSPRGVSQAFARNRPGAVPGDYAVVSIQDTGAGMDPAVAAHIFEPFFTTKQSGKGTGLGLAVVYGLVQQHQGFIDIETAPGRGTTFHLYFPRQEASVEEGGGRQPGAVSSSSKRGTESVVLIEPESRQRSLNEQILAESGYRVAGTMDTVAALEQLQARNVAVDAAILESSIGVAGPEAAIRAILRIYPRCRVVVVAEYLSPELRSAETAWPGLRILRKPYVPADLLGEVRLALEGPEAPAVPAAPQRAPERKRILVVDDDTAIRLLCERILAGGYDVTTVPSARAALDALTAGGYDLLVTDLRMPNMDGVTLLGEVTKLKAKPKMIAMTGSLTAELEQRLRDVSLSHPVIHKPFSAPTLIEAVGKVLTNGHGA